MGASSVTGISGPGSSEGGFRGPGNGRNEYVSLISPHVITAGVVTLSGGVATVSFPASLSSGNANYVVILTDATALHPASVGTTTNDSNGNFASFVVNGTGSDVINYIVVSVGHGA
jgi:hypothetical protein